MTPLQHEQIMQLLIQMQAKITSVTDRLQKVEEAVNKLTNKTIVISDINSELAKLKVELDSLKDEKEV